MPHLEESHRKSYVGYEIKDIILGAQDGLVNVLGIILAVAVATADAKLVIISGLAATFAESISMAAVAYTSTKSLKDYYFSEMEREKREIKEIPNQEIREIRDIYRKKGFKGKLLGQIVRKITSDKKLWLRTMMTEELNLPETANQKPINSAAIVGVAAIAGSLVPLLPFFFAPLRISMAISVAASVVALFSIGFLKAKLTDNRWIRSGTEIAVIGMLAAAAGYLIGVLLGVIVR